MKVDFYTSMKERRSIYSISKQVEVSDDRIKEVIEYSLKHTPTAFNSQSGRIVLLLDSEHDKLWNLTKDALKKIVPEEKFQNTSDKIDSFKSGYGTVLFFEATDIIESLQNQFPSYKKNFPLWSQQASGILQYNVWTSLTVEGLGATLQHYTELIEESVKDYWNIEEKWKMVAQMPFGKPTAEPNAKEFIEMDKRFKLYK